MSAITRKKKSIDPLWKKRLAAMLTECGLVAEDFTGTVRLSLSAGGVASLTKEETLR